MLFQKLADENADVDPDDGQRAPFVAKALTALAGYLRARRQGDRRGARSRARRRLPAPRGDLLRRQGRAVRAGQGLSGRRRHARGREARHALSVGADRGRLSRRAGACSPICSGAAATSRRTSSGRWRSSPWRSRTRPTHERIWIEDIYQNIFCGTSQGTRKQADGIVAVWRKMFARRRPAGRPHGPGRRELQPQRPARNGEVVDIRRASEQSGAVARRPPSRPRHAGRARGHAGSATSAAASALARALSTHAGSRA